MKLNLDGNKTNIGIVLTLAGALLAQFMPDYAELGATVQNLGFAVLGIGVLWRYLARTPVPDLDDEPESDARDDRGPATGDADAQDAGSGTGTVNAQQPRGA